MAPRRRPADAPHLLRAALPGWRRALALVTLAVAAVTGVLYLLPLGQRAHDTVSNTTFTVLALMNIAVAGVRSRRSTGLHRAAWGAVAVAFTITAVLFTIRPQETSGELTLALDYAIIPSLAFWIAVIALSAPALPGLASLRTAADALWATTATIIAVWPWTIDPLLHTIGPTPYQRTLHVAFAVSTIALATTVLVVVPHTVGRGRTTLGLLGIGGAVTSAAGVLHIRFWYEGTLRSGSAWDYLWTLGIGTLVLAGLVETDEALRPRRRDASWHALMTAGPLMLALGALTTQSPGRGELVATTALLITLALRVLALLAENDRLTRDLTRDAANDPLTGLGNRRILDAGLDRVGANAVEGRRERAVLLVDLDHFKNVNDTHGHLVGDEVLRIVARRLRDAVRDTDILVRNGGDEFLATMTVRDRDEAAHAARRLQDAVRGTYALAVGAVEIGATVGVAVDDGTGERDDILAVADAALYAAKRTGRGTVRIESAHHVDPARATR